MFVSRILSKIWFYPQSVYLRLKISTARSLLNSSWRWYALDQLGIYGHGNDLLRVDFPPKKDSQPLWGYGSSPHIDLSELINANLPQQLQILKAVLELAQDYQSWSENEDLEHPHIPWRKNDFLLPFDTVSIYGMLQYLRPKRYLEIGSGMSTRIASLARTKGNFPMEIISIDPEPRFAISQMCDQVYRMRLEDFDCEKFLSLVTPETVVFFDGSHRVFPSSDVTVFFLNLLPKLPKGCTVHIHDIYLPNDYPSHALNRLWSEQYLLAAYLLGGAKNIQILLPCASLSSNLLAQNLIEEVFDTRKFDGCSFWLTII